MIAALADLNAAVESRPRRSARETWLASSAWSCSVSCCRVPPQRQAPAAREARRPVHRAVFDSMDTRVPGPLFRLPMMANHQKQNMRDHLAAVQEIVGAVGAEDFAAIVARRRATIGYSEQMGQMCNHMGAGAPGFTDQALASIIPPDNDRGRQQATTCRASSAP